MFGLGELVGPEGREAGARLLRDAAVRSATVQVGAFADAGQVGRALPQIATAANAELGDGNYLFLANRRTVWAINKKEGRFAGYDFRDDDDRSIERTRIVTLNQTNFPPADTVYILSDRNLTEALWVCNRRTGDIQLWTPRLGGQVVAEQPVTTLGTGDYEFLANRRTIWSVNKAKGEFARFDFRNHEDRTVERTKTIKLDARDFPPEDTVFHMSDRNFTEVLWVCNRRTGDIQIWTPRLGGALVSEKPLVTKEDLRRKK